RADEGAPPRGGARPARGGRRREAPDRRRGAEVGVRGSDAALRPRAAVAGTYRAPDGVRRLGVPRAALRRADGARGRGGCSRPAGACGARAARARGERALRLSGGVSRALLREAALPVRPARARRSDDVPRARARRRRARRRAGAEVRPRGGGGMTAVGAILEKAVDGERISDDEGLTLLGSRDPVSVGRAANEIRNRKADPTRITFIIDRNLNYTNICYTDCEFCAFYRRPGDTREGYLLPKAVIFKKIEETLALGGTGLLMQGGHHPDL